MLYLGTLILTLVRKRILSQCRLEMRKKKTSHEQILQCNSYFSKKLPLLEGAVGGNFSAALTGAVFLSCGAVMERRTVRMAVMRKAAMEPCECVMRKQSSPARVQVGACRCIFLSLTQCLCEFVLFDHISTL